MYSTVYRASVLFLMQATLPPIPQPPQPSPQHTASRLLESRSHHQTHRRRSTWTTPRRWTQPMCCALTQTVAFWPAVWVVSTNSSWHTPQNQFRRQHHHHHQTKTESNHRHRRPHRRHRRHRHRRPTSITPKSTLTSRRSPIKPIRSFLASSVHSRTSARSSGVLCLSTAYSTSIYPPVFYLKALVIHSCRCSSSPKTSSIVTRFSSASREIDLIEMLSCACSCSSGSLWSHPTTSCALRTTTSCPWSTTSNRERFSSIDQIFFNIYPL